MKAYISSTYSDIRPYRDAAFDVVRRMGVQPLGMEYFGASAALPVEECIRTVRESDVCVVVVGHRYGFIPEGFDKSITELEVDAAREAGIPVLAFVLSDEVPVRVSAIERDPARASQLDAFKQRLYQNLLVGRVDTPEGFAASLASSLHRLQAELAPPRRKDEPSGHKLAECRQEVDRYKRVIEDLNAKLTRIVPADPIWRGRSFETDGLLCFALMPFADEHFEVYETAIAPAAEKQGLRSLHAGEIFGNREIVEDIWDSICAARIIIADVTGRNPNVFYELGICHTLGKECIVITQNRDDVPFDIRHRRFLEYDTAKLTSLRNRLGKTIQAVLTRRAGGESDAQQGDAADGASRRS